MDVDVTALSSTQTDGQGRIGVTIRWKGTGNRYVVALQTNLKKYSTSRFTKEVNGQWYSLAESNFKIGINCTQKVKATADGNRFIVYVNLTKVFDVIDDSHSEGQAGLYSNAMNGKFDNVLIRDLTSPSLKATIIVESYTVAFKGNATSGVPPYNYYWDFGDGGTSVEQNPVHTYTKAGTYTVTLIVTDSTGYIITRTISSVGV